MKRLMSVLILSLFIATPAFAGHGECKMSDGDCKMKSSDCKMKSDCKDENMCPITAKFFKKAHFFLANKEEIGLSDAQVKEIKALKFEAEKKSIRMKADMEIWHMDLMEKLTAEDATEESVGAFLEQAGPVMAQAGKDSVSWYFKLKAVLTPEQMTKAKAIWAKKK